MKKLLVVLCLAAVSCKQPDPNAIKQSSIGWADVNTYVIDSCEYIGDLVGDTRGYFLTHKGNCKNPIHHDTQDRTHR